MTVAGIEFEAPNEYAVGLIAIALELRPAQVNVLGCVRCKTVCIETLWCACCEHVQRKLRRSTGPHVTMMTRAAFAAAFPSVVEVVA